jgi:hypothetical protein
MFSVKSSCSPFFPSSPILHYSFNLIRPPFLLSTPRFPCSISLLPSHISFLKLAQTVAISAYYNYSNNIWSFKLIINFWIHFYSPIPIAMVGRVTQSVYRLTTGWTFRGSKPGGGEIFRTRPDRPWGPPSLLYNGYRAFSRGKATGAWC